jgi:hypothetical protein
MKSTAILSCADRVATYFDGLAAGCSEAGELMLSVLKLVRQTIADIEREAAEV